MSRPNYVRRFQRTDVCLCEACCKAVPARAELKAKRDGGRWNGRWNRRKVERGQ